MQADDSTEPQTTPRPARSTATPSGPAPRSSPRPPGSSPRRASAAPGSIRSRCARAPTSACSTTISATRRRSTSSCSRRPTPASAAPRRRSTSATATPRRLRELALFTWRYFVEHPEFISLLNTENLMRARFLKGSKRIREMQTHLRSASQHVLRRGERGAVRRRPRPAARLPEHGLDVGLLPVEPVHAVGDLRPRARPPSSSPPGRRTLCIRCWRACGSSNPAPFRGGVHSRLGSFGELG